MYLTFTQIKKSHDKLACVHPFFLITFLTCKAARLPVAKPIHFRISTKELEHLHAYFKTDPSSQQFYRLSRVGSKTQRWLSSTYPSSGSQKTRTSTFSQAFVHDRGGDLWAWQASYVSFLAGYLHEYSHPPIPAFDLSVWLYREVNWPAGTEPADIIQKFIADFELTTEEQNALFEVSVPDSYSHKAMFRDKQVSWRELRTVTGIPPDAIPEEGGTLALLELHGIGPAPTLSMTLADRINLITGDNGLGKTFLLDCAWWALAGSWAGLPAFPRSDARKSEPRIVFRIAADGGAADNSTARYQWDKGNWRSPPNRPTIPGLLIYARVDGSYSVWDPVRVTPESNRQLRQENPTLLFSPKEIWHGLPDPLSHEGTMRCNGIVHDWVAWQHHSDPHTFDTFCKVLERLSPSDLGVLEPGPPTRLPGDSRLIPTITHSYGTVPILHASAGVKRIIALAYLLVWAWEEHQTQSLLLRKPVQRRLVVLLDEIEAHLHPQWQRLILPALTAITDDLDAELSIQLLVTTHSPLVTASLEPLFSRSSDKLFTLALISDPDNPSASTVNLTEMPFMRHGPSDRWLTSPIFNLEEPRSIEAEEAIAQATLLQDQNKPDPDEIKSVSERLTKYLADDDAFWPRWVCFAENHGVDL